MLLPPLQNIPGKRSTIFIGQHFFYSLYRKQTNGALTGWTKSESASTAQSSLTVHRLYPRLCKDPEHEYSEADIGFCVSGTDEPPRRLKNQEAIGRAGDVRAKFYLMRWAPCPAAFSRRRTRCWRLSSVERTSLCRMESWRPLARRPAVLRTQRRPPDGERGRAAVFQAGGWSVSRNDRLPTQSAHSRQRRNASLIQRKASHDVRCLETDLLSSISRGFRIFNGPC